MKTLMYSIIGILGMMGLAAVLYGIFISGYGKQILFVLGVYVVIHALIMWSKVDLGHKPKDKS